MRLAFIVKMIMRLRRVEMLIVAHMEKAFDEMIQAHLDQKVPKVVLRA